MPPKSPPQGMSGGTKAAILFFVLLLLAGAGFAIWWFLIRKKEEAPSPTPTVVGPEVAYVGRLYGNTDLSKMYSFVNTSSVKVLRTGQACTTVSWKFTDKNTIQIGSEAFTVQDENTLKGTEQFDRLTGDLDAYCNLIGA